MVYSTGSTTVASIQRDSGGDEPLVLSGGILTISNASEESDVATLTLSEGANAGRHGHGEGRGHDLDGWFSGHPELRVFEQ